MTTETVRVLIGGGFFMMLLVLRLEARRFGAAEYDEPGDRRRGVLTRISWYLVGLALLGGLYVVHPAPHDALGLVVGHWTDVETFGGGLAVGGLAVAALVAWLRYGYLRLPAARAYPGAALNSIATAAIDEATFRGAFLGTLLVIGLPDGWSVLVSAIVYLLVTRLAAPGHHWSMLLVAVFLGFAGGWVTVQSGGIGAAIIGHAVTSFALFVFTGHAGQVPVSCGEPEELAMLRLPPPGWQDVRLAAPASDPRAAAAQPYPQPIGPSGFSSRAARKSIRKGPAGIISRMRSADRTAAARNAATGSGRNAAARTGRPPRPSR